MIKHVDYIWDSTNFPRWNANGYINTGIYAVDDIEIRIAYQGAGANVDRIAGFLPADGVSDSNDFRFFFYTNGSLDVKNTRQSNLFSVPPTQSGVDYDITFGNRFVFDNLTQTQIYTASQVTPINQSCTIRVDVNGQKVKSLQIKKNGVVVFDAFAALDDSNNTVGLYDTVSETMFTNSSLNMTYGQIVNTFTIEPETMEFSYTGGTSALTIESENNWTASTNSEWITLSSTAGTGESAITVTIAENTTFQDRLGTVSITDGNDTLTCSISQEKAPKTAFSNKFHYGDTLIKKMYLNGDLIFQNLFSFIFNVDTTEVEMDYTGGTFTVAITANKPWSITTPNWISTSTVSGSGNANVTFYVDYNYDSSRSGNITISCNGESKTISVEQGAESNVHYISSLTFGENAWINTGVYSSIDIGFEMRNVTIPQKEYYCFVGAEERDSQPYQYRIRTDVNWTSIHICIGDGWNVINVSQLPNNETVIMKKDYYQFGEYTGNTNATTLSGGLSIYIGAENRNGSAVDGKGGATIGEVLMWDDGVLVRDFKPALDENDEPCYYDEVTQEYFYNQGNWIITGNE